MIDPNDNKCPPYGRANDIWISASMVSVLMAIIIGVITIQNGLTKSAIDQEQRFTRLEEKVKAISEDISYLKNKQIPDEGAK